MVAISLRLYRALARVFPQEFQNAYGEDLLQVTEDAIEIIWRRHGLMGLVRLLLDIAIRVPAEHAAKAWQDMRYGLRMLAKSPGFTVAALLSLGLGIACGTSAFSFMNATILRNVPGIQNPGELVSLRAPVSFINYRSYRERTNVFSSTLAYTPVPCGVATGGRTERSWGHLVTPLYFSALGVRPVLGRVFDKQHEQSGAPPAEVVISHRFWQVRLGSDPAVIGTTLRINGRPSTVIGVGPPEFLGASPLLFEADLWMPIEGDVLERREVRIFQMVGRLQPGVTTARAQAELETVARQLEQTYGDADRDRKERRVALATGGRLVPIRSENLPMLLGFPLVLVGLILLIACSNVANMMLARAAGRRKEIAVRLALGASRARLIRQLLTESMLVAAGAGMLGLFLTALLMQWISRADVLRFAIRAPYPTPVSSSVAPDGRVLLFTLGLAVFTGLAFGLAPAFRATGRLQTYGRWSARNFLVLSQVAASLTVLLLTGILALGYQRTMRIEAGFDPRNLYVASLDPGRDAAFFPSLLERLRGLPGIAAVTLTDTMSLWAPPASVTFSTAAVIRSADKHVAGAGYFETLGIPIRLGRDFRREDEAKDAMAVIVSERLVRDFWGGESPLGRRVEIGSRVFEVVGVAGNTTSYFSLEPPRPAIYFPLRPDDYVRPSFTGLTLMVRAAPGVDPLGAVRREVAALDDSLTLFNASSMAEQIDRMMFVGRLGVWIHGFNGMFGLILASVGLVGMTAYSVAQRGREIGIRIALGAQSADVLRLVMKEGAVLVSAGAIIGLAGARAGIRLLSAFMSPVARVAGAGTSDAMLWVAAPMLLAGLALVACYVPARKSLRIDPVVALRQE